MSHVAVYMKTLIDEYLITRRAQQCKHTMQTYYAYIPLKIMFFSDIVGHSNLPTITQHNAYFSLIGSI